MKSVLHTLELLFCLFSITAHASCRIPQWLMIRTSCLLCIALGFLQGCATPLPVSDMLVHTQGSRLKGNLEEGRTFTIHAQSNTLSKATVLEWAKLRFRDNPSDTFGWLRSDATGLTLGITAPVIEDRLAVGITSGWFMFGADATAALPYETFLTLSYGWSRQGSILLQRRIVNHPKVNIAAGGFYRADRLHVFADYSSDDPDSEPRDCDSIFCGLSFPHQESIRLGTFGARASGVVFTRGPSEESYAYVRFILEGGYAPSVKSWIGSGAFAFVIP